MPAASAAAKYFSACAKYGSPPQAYLYSHGSANPFVMQPLLAQPDLRPMRAPLQYDTCRGQLSATFDL